MWIFDIILIFIFGINVKWCQTLLKSLKQRKPNNLDISLKCYFFFNNLEKQLSSLARPSSTLMHMVFFLWRLEIISFPSGYPKLMLWKACAYGQSTFLAYLMCYFDIFFKYETCIYHAWLIWTRILNLFVACFSYNHIKQKKNYGKASRLFRVLREKKNILAIER